MRSFLFSFLLISTVVVSGQDREFKLDKEYEVSVNGTVDLTSSDAKVFITGSSRKNAHVKINRKVTSKGFHKTTDEFRVEVENDDGNLRIKDYKKSISVGIVRVYREEYRIEIDVPGGMSLVVRGDDGDYFLKNVNGSISMRLDDADAELVDCKGDKFSFRIDDGNIRMNTGRGTLEIDADDAGIDIENGAFTSIDIYADDGDIIMETSLAENGIYNISSKDGLVALTITGGGGEFDIRHDDGRITSDDNYTIRYESKERTNLSLGKGSAKVTVYADDAGVKLTSRN